MLNLYTLGDFNMDSMVDLLISRDPQSSNQMNFIHPI